MKDKRNYYQNQKEEISSIIRRIDKKRSMEIFMERSEGTLMQTQIQLELKNIQKKNQKSKTFNFSNYYRNRIVPQRKIKTQNPNNLQFCLNKCKRASITTDIKNNQNQKENNQSVNYNAQKILKNKKNNNLNQFRPQLQQYNKYLSVTDASILKRRRRIIQMLILCLMRRCHKKLQQALDLAIQVSSNFQQNDSQIILKSICLTLIGKIYKQINSKLQSQKKKVKNSGARLRVNNKRHSSLMIKTLASQRAFFNRFTHKFKKSKLVKQTTFKRQEQLKVILQSSKNRQSFENFVNSSQLLLSKKNKKNKPVMAQISSTLAVTFAHPTSIFGQNSTNYKIVVHQRDNQNNLFPYQYPSTLTGLIQKKDYILMVSNINGIIFPTANCYNMRSSLKSIYTSLFLIFIFMFLLLISVQINYSQESFWIFFVYSIFIVFIVVSCYYFVKKNKNQEFRQIYQRLVSQLQKWQKQYKDQNLKFRCTQSFQAFFICGQIHEDQQSQCSNSVSNSNKDSINEEQNEQNILSGSIYCKDSVEALQTIKQHTFKQVQSSIKSLQQQQKQVKDKAKQLICVQFQSQSEDQIVNQTLKRQKKNSVLNLDCFQFIKDQQFNLN